jgi:uncharacterized coiled-coil protein SlyX
MVKFRQLLITISIAATLVASCAFAQTNLTQILDTITNPDGSPFNGTVVITWNGYSGSGSGTVSRLSTSARVYNGALSVLLVATTTASPGTYYQVVYSSSNGTAQWTETWQVPPSTTALTVSAVRQTTTQGSGSGSGSGGQTGTGGSQYATLPIAISSITNLASSLSSINSTLTTVQSTATALGTTVSGLSTTVSGLNSTVTTQGATLGTLGTTVTGLNTTVTGQGTTLSNLSNTVSGLNTTVTNQAASISGLNTTVSGLTSTVNTQGSSFTTLSNSVGTLNTTVSGQAASITSLNSSLSSLTATVATDTTSLTNVNSTVGGLSTNVTNLTNLVNGLNSTVSSLSNVSSSAVFVDSEVPSGAIDGTNLIFSLANPPAPTASLTIFRNGLALSAGVDYTLSGSAVTFLSASKPQAGDMLLAYYRMAGSGSTTNFTDGETPGGTINGTNVTFTLASAPNPSTSLRLFRNGLLVAPGVEYTMSGSSLTFTSARTPQTGDSLAAYYRH